MKTKKVTGGSQHVGKDGLTHYQRNKQVYIEKNLRRIRENLAYLREYKSKLGCKDCGTTDWRVLDFDHMPGHIKITNIGDRKALSWGRKRLDEEIAKCEVVCANCHRIRTIIRASEV